MLSLNLVNIDVNIDYQQSYYINVYKKPLSSSLKQFLLKREHNLFY